MGILRERLPGMTASAPVLGNDLVKGSAVIGFAGKHRLGAAFLQRAGALRVSPV
jgi:hypothetical protein